MESLRIVFMGTPDFSVPALARLAQSQHDVAAEAEKLGRLFSAACDPAARGPHALA